MTEPLTATPTKYACARCIWANKQIDGGIACCKNPPTAVYNEVTDQYVGVWPRVSEEHWCGQFTPRRDA